jgi:hypothetical protein
LEWQDFATILDPLLSAEKQGATLYITIAGLFLWPFALVRAHAVTWWLLTVALLSIAVALGGHLGLFARFTHLLPMLAQTRTPIRAIMVYNFATAGLVALGLDTVARVTPWPAVARCALALLVGWGVYQFTGRVGMPRGRPDETVTYYYRNAGLDALVRVSNNGPLVDRYISLPFEAIPPNAGDMLPVLNTLGHRGTYLTSLHNFMSDWDIPASASFDALGVRWVIARQPQANMQLIEQGDGYFLYERPRHPSVLWTDNGGGPQKVPVTAVEWGQNRVTFDIVPATSSRLIVFAQARYPGWTVEVDGTGRDMQNVSIFNAVQVEGGAKSVTFAYRPNLLGPLALTGLVIAAWLGALLLARRRR